MFYCSAAILQFHKKHKWLPAEQRARPSPQQSFLSLAAGARLEVMNYPHKARFHQNTSGNSHSTVQIKRRRISEKWEQPGEVPGMDLRAAARRVQELQRLLHVSEQGKMTFLRMMFRGSSTAGWLRARTGEIFILLLWLVLVYQFSQKDFQMI